MTGSSHPRDAASALADIAGRQRAVIDAVLVPTWYWWTIAAGMIAIGAAVDYRHPVLLGIAIAIAVAVMAALTGLMIFGGYRRVRVRSPELLGGQGAVSIVGFVWLVVGLTLGCAFGLRALGTPAPATIGTAVGGAVLILAGPRLMSHLRRLMLARRAGHEPAGVAQ